MLSLSQTCLKILWAHSVTLRGACFIFRGRASLRQSIPQVGLVRRIDGMGVASTRVPCLPVLLVLLRLSLSQWGCTAESRRNVAFQRPVVRWGRRVVEGNTALLVRRFPLGRRPPFGPSTRGPNVEGEGRKLPRLRWRRRPPPNTAPSADAAAPGAIRLRFPLFRVTVKSPPPLLPVESLDELNEVYTQLSSPEKHPQLLRSLSVVGRCPQNLKPEDHPAVRVLHDRLRDGSKPGHRTDGYKVGLAIEGGGMRGAVSAGAAAAMSVLGMEDAVDCVYGSSAGALVAGFFVSRQLNGTVIYSDVLPKAGPAFLDKNQLLMTFLGQARDRPVLNTQFLLHTVLKEMVILDWEKMWQNNRVQPVNIVASSLSTMQSVALNSEKGHFSCFESFLRCMQGSMCVPGVAGPAVKLGEGEDADHLVDSLLFEPIPYRCAIEDGCTHVIVLRTKPNGAEILGKRASGIYEKLIGKRFLQRLSRSSAQYLANMQHLRTYVEDVLLLNQAAETREGVVVPEHMRGGGRRVHLFPVAPPATCTEVETLEMSREALVQGLKDGFMQAWDFLTPPHLKHLRGKDVADMLFGHPDFEERWAALLAEHEEGRLTMRSTRQQQPAREAAAV